MAEVTIKKSNSEKSVEWFWQSNPNPWSKSEPVKWSQYSDVQNLIIEEAFCNKKLKVELDGYDIDFEHNVQISKEDENKQRPIKRTMRKREDKHLREERFMINPIGSKRPFGGQYGWVSPLILEVRRHLGLTRNQLPSKDEQLVPILVEKAAQGITEGDKQIGKQREAEKLANMLREAKNQGIKKVWQRCVYLYSLESFLYKKINEMMQLIGDEEHENIWRSKFSTLGPFCLLLWDDPFDTKMKTKTTLYRGANLSEEQLATYEKMATNPKEYRSFQAFTSCSRNREKVNRIENTLFIMNILSAFIADISALSEYPDEEEELVIPGVCFNVQGVEFDKKAKKYLIYLRLRQRFNNQHKNEITTTENSNAQSDEYYASAYDLDSHAVDDARGIFLVYARDGDRMYGDLDDDQFGDTISYLVRAASGRVAYVTGDYVSFDRDGTVIH